jgi:hypothetical protein
MSAKSIVLIVTAVLFYTFSPVRFALACEKAKSAANSETEGKRALSSTSSNEPAKTTEATQSGRQPYRHIGKMAGD